MSEDRCTIPVPASELSDAALLADWRARRNRLSAEEMADIKAGCSLALTGSELASGESSVARSMRRRQVGRMGRR